MVFDIKGKVALITGGASGLGLEFAKELLRNGLKGVTLADVNEAFGKTALSQIDAEFGPNKAIFVKTDVVDLQQFEEAFKKTIEQFQNVDILINNAGILNDATWEREIATNIHGVIHGMLLGVDKYLPKYKQGSEAVIINISSTCGVEAYPHIPVYCGTKFAIIGISKSWGTAYHYERTKVRVAIVCPGVTNTPLVLNMSGKNLGEPYERYIQTCGDAWARQETDHVAKELVKVIKVAPTGTIWLVEGGETAYEFVIPEREKIEKKYIKVE